MSVTKSHPAKRGEEDLFSETTMTFGEHLEELRACLWKACLGLVIGTLLGFLVGDYVVEAIERPLTAALKVYYRTAAETEYSAWAEGQKQAGKPVPYTIKEIKAIAEPKADGEKELIFELEFVHPQTLQATLDAVNGPGGDGTQSSEAKPQDLAPGDAKSAEEPPKKEGEAAPLRYTRGTLGPLLLWHPIDSDSRFKMQATGATEAFTVWLKAALVVGVLISSPWVFYQIWSFVAAGLYHNERKYVYTFLPFSLGLFFAGAATAYLFVFEPVLNFLFSFNQTLGIDPDPKISEWLGFVLLLPLGFGVSFQLPLVMLFLQRIGVFTPRDYIEKWRISVLVIVVVSAVLTPADPYSIFFMAVPLVFLYFGGILLAKYLPQSR